MNVYIVLQLQAGGGGSLKVKRKHKHRKHHRERTEELLRSVMVYGLTFCRFVYMSRIV